MGIRSNGVRRYLIFASIAAILSSAGSVAAACETEAVDLRGDWGTARFSVDIADDNAERAQGLMDVPSMPRGQGMLFIYDEPGPVSFWMRNTLIPLDMIFLGSDGVVDHVHSNAVPGDETSIFGGDEIVAVLEINGGLARQLGIGPGTEMRHPSFDAELATWSCED